MNKEEKKLALSGAEGIVPQLRFPEFDKDGEWKEEPLNKLAKKVTEKNRKGLVDKVFTNSAIDGIVDQREYFDKDIADKSNLENYYVVKNGDFVYNPRISNIAPVGPISKNKMNCSGVMSPLYTVFRFNREQNDFFEYYFKTNHWYSAIRKASNTGARFDRMSITDSVFMGIPVLSPKPEEQQKIAACLSSLDDVITAETEKLDLLQDHKKGLLQQLFPNPLNHDSQGFRDNHDFESENKSRNQANQKNHGSDNVPRFRFPEFEKDGDWEDTTLGEISSITTGRLDANAMIENGQYRFYTCARNYYFINDYEFDTEALLISGNGANVGYIHYYKGKFNAYQRTYVLDKFKKDVHYIKYFLELKLSKRIAEEKKEGNTPYIVKATLADMELLIPKNPKEQQKIAACLSAADELIEAQAQKVEALQVHKKGLLQQLFPNVND